MRLGVHEILIASGDRACPIREMLNTDFTIGHGGRRLWWPPCLDVVILRHPTDGRVELLLVLLDRLVDRHPGAAAAGDHPDQTGRHE